MTSKVAIVDLDDGAGALSLAFQQIGGINELNTCERPVVVKVGVFSHKAENHSSVSVVKAIVDSFDRAP